MNQVSESIFNYYIVRMEIEFFELFVYVWAGRAGG